MFRIFCLETSFHGVYSFYASKNLIMKALWAIVLMVAFGGMFITVLQQFANSQETFTNLSIVYKPVTLSDLPKVAICLQPPGIFNLTKLESDLNDEQVETVLAAFTLTNMQRKQNLWMKYENVLNSTGHKSTSEFLNHYATACSDIVVEPEHFCETMLLKINIYQICWENKIEFDQLSDKQFLYKTKSMFSLRFIYKTNPRASVTGVQIPPATLVKIGYIQPAYQSQEINIEKGTTLKLDINLKRHQKIPVTKNCAPYKLGETQDYCIHKKCRAEIFSSACGCDIDLHVNSSLPGCSPLAWEKCFAKTIRNSSSIKHFEDFQLCRHRCQLPCEMKEASIFAINGLIHDDAEDDGCIGRNNASQFTEAMVDISLAKDHIEIIAEHSSQSFMALLAHFGGLMSFWLGCSVVSFIHFFILLVFPSAGTEKIIVHNDAL